jgi:hypothetical protein
LQDPAVVQALGFSGERTPCVATLHLVFKDLDVVAFEAALRTWAQRQLGQGGEAIALDGKGLRGSHGEELPGVRLVAAYATRVAWCWRQRGVKGEEHEVGLSLAPDLVAALPRAGRLGTGDALDCQRQRGAQIVAAQGHSLVLVQANQPQLSADSALRFAPPPPGEQRGRHGDRQEVRRRWAATALRG